MGRRPAPAVTVARAAELSVVVPVLNEEAALPALLACLAGQREVALEVLVCDGGSSDRTIPLVSDLARTFPFRLQVVASPPGRAVQMNAGAAEATAPWLLFLHADSLLDDRLALRAALDCLAAARAARGHDRIAGRFALHFRRGDRTSSWGFYHLECKARLDRPGCVHGDQGLLLPRTCFAIAGPFDHSVPMLAETRLADRLRREGDLLLLPAAIHTSARRFEQEGLCARQVVNAIAMNCAAIGWQHLLDAPTSLYRPHHRCGKLQLAPLLRTIAGLLGALPLRQRFSFWYATGRYVRANAWQIPFALDTRRSFRRRIPPGAGTTPLVRLHDLLFDRCTDHSPGHLAAACLTWVWFRLACRYPGRQGVNPED